MSGRYEYKFVRLGERKSWFWGRSWGHLPVDPAAVQLYQDAVQDHAADGWRLVQILTPGTMMNRYTAYYELIFEREVEGTEPATAAQQAEPDDEWHLTEKPGSIRQDR